MTVLEAIQSGTVFLAGKGVDSPRLQSELLLAHVLSTERLKLYLDFGRVLTAEETGTLRELIRRRGRREPYQHLAGSTSFCGLEIEVSPAALIPRPETELLAEAGWDFLQALGRPARFLDFGTGTGCIAIALLVRAALSEGYAVDKSGPALELARSNARRHGVSHRLHFFEGESLAILEAGSRFDLIISNPPYIPSAEIAQLQEEVRDFDPRLALDGGADGFDFYRLLAGTGAGLLAPGGRLLAEFGDGQERGVVEIFAQAGWEVREVRPDLCGKARFIAVQRSE